MAEYRKILYLTSALIMIFILLFSFDGTLKSQFLVDGEEVKKAEEEREKEIERRDNRLPGDAARNIKAELIADIKGAVRITWDMHQEATGDYMVGRSTEVPDTMEKALKAVSVKIIPAGAPRVVIDAKLATGAYYYCILSRKKIMDRDVELYPDMNYTVNPVVIENERLEPENNSPQQVSLIYARVMNQRNVLLTWRGVDIPGILYTIYRSKVPLDSPQKVLNADKLYIISDGRESYVDKDIFRSQTYYYAVTTKDVEGKEDLNLIPDQSYTGKGVYINLGSNDPVTGIDAKPLESGSVNIVWENTSTGVTEYMVYRYSQPISDEKRLAMAVFAGRISGDKNSYIDENPGSGKIYYAVLSMMGDGKLNNQLVRGSNFTTEPVSLDEQVKMKSFMADLVGKDIHLEWRSTGSAGSRNYKIVRSNAVIKSISDISGTSVIASVDIFDQSFIDQNLQPGTYYYAIIPESVDKEYELINGVNVLNEGIAVIEKVQGKKESKIVKEPLIEKRFEKGTAEVTPEVSGADAIIRNNFYNDKFEITISELKKIVKSSDNKYEIAKARLYIGRSLIELKKYRKAVDYLILTDVKESFPKESEFWKDFALYRIHNISEK